VTISYCNRKQYPKRWLWIAPPAIIFLLLSVLVYAETSSEKPVPERIAMESDKAVINRAERIIELEGNVKVSQGETVITSNMIRLFLKEGAKLDAPQKTGENAIEKIVAKGNVIFKLDIGTAYSDQAEYTAATKLLVLTGKEPKFISGENTITGSKITVNRDSGMVIFEGGGKSRVEAVIYSKEKL
jgi:lipopolysaccharide export system protein LptA